MKKTRVIDPIAWYPTKLWPVVGIATEFPVLSYWSAPGWAYGVWGTLRCLFWLLMAYRAWNTKRVNPFTDPDWNKPE